MDRRRTDDSDDRRSSRDRDEDRGSRGRDRDDNRSSRSSSRDRDDERGSRSSRSRDDDDERGSSRRGSSGGYEYQGRSADSVRKRADNDSKFDKLLKAGIKMWKPNDGENRIRIVPPTWEGKQEHYGVDIHVHYGVGADRQSYLCLHKMQGKPDPIHEEYERFARECDPENKKDAEYLRELKGTGRVLIYLVDRDNEKEGVQAWAMPAGVDRDIVKISVDRDTGEVLPIDHPEDGFDVMFDKTGKGVNTKYEGISIARRSTPLGKREWLEFARENPLPDQLQYFEYDHIAKAFGGGGTPKPRDEDDRDRDGARRDRDDSRNRDDDRRGGREEKSRNEKDDLTWDAVHDMTKSELRDVIESEKLDIDPSEAKDKDDLADWVCKEMGLEQKKRRRGDDEDDRGSRSRDRDTSDDERMARMRERVRD